MRTVRARIFALLAALVMLLPGGASAHGRYYCRMMGRVVASCCCGPDARAPTPKHAQEIQEADCCHRISSTTRSASLGTRQAVREIAAAALSPAVREPFDVQPGTDTGNSCAESTQAPLAIGPPLFVVHCAFLS